MKRIIIGLIIAVMLILSAGSFSVPESEVDMPYIPQVKVGNTVYDLKDRQSSYVYSILWDRAGRIRFPNLLTGIRPKTGVYVAYDTGKESTNSDWQCYTVPSPGDYRVSSGAGNAHVAYFNKHGEYISGANVNFQANYSFDIPENCSYFIYSCPISDPQYLTIASYTGGRVLDDSKIAELELVHINIGNMPDIIKPKKNLFNKYKAITGGFIDYSYKGSFYSNDEYAYCTWFIPVKPSTKYKPNSYCVIGEFDKDYNWIKSDNITTAAAYNQTPITTDENCHYIRISVRTEHIDDFMLEEGEYTTSYAPFQMTFVGDDETEETTRTIIVDINGTGNYTSITEACASANDGDTIYIKDGVYYESVKINGLNVHLVGESREKTILKYLGTQYANPPLEMSNGSIENMTIWAITESGASGGGGYCLHCDNEASANGSLTCRNVKFQNDYYQVVGVGLQPNFTLSFEDCEFIGQVYIHDCAKNFQDLSGQVIRMINCSILAENQQLGAVRFQSQERSGANATALFQRCIIKNIGSSTVVHMGLWEDNGLAKNGWLGSSDWHLDEMSDLNNASIVNAN